MSEYYFEARVGRPAPCDYGTRMGEVFFALHRSIRKEGEGKAGLSFPGWKGGSCREEVSLGERIYVVSPCKESLDRVVSMLERDAAAVEHGDIQMVPEGVRRMIFSRSRKHQRYFHFARHGDQAGREKAKMHIKGLPAMPSVAMKSSSTGQKFLLLIDQRDESEASGVDAFNSYGLSSGLSVPVF